MEGSSTVRTVGDRLSLIAYIACATASVMLDRAVNQRGFTLVMTGVWVIAAVVFVSGFLLETYRTFRAQHAPLPETLDRPDSE